MQAQTEATDTGAYGLRYDPYLRLIEAIFKGAYGNYPMALEQRIKWMQENMPKTFGMIATGKHWSVLSDAE